MSCDDVFCLPQVASLAVITPPYYFKIICPGEFKFYLDLIQLFDASVVMSRSISIGRMDFISSVGGMDFISSVGGMDFIRWRNGFHPLIRTL